MVADPSPSSARPSPSQLGGALVESAWPPPELEGFSLSPASRLSTRTDSLSRSRFVKTSSQPGAWGFSLLRVALAPRGTARACPQATGWLRCWNSCLFLSRIWTNLWTFPWLVCLCVGLSPGLFDWVSAAAAVLDCRNVPPSVV